MATNAPSRRRGFTLIEVMVVVTILGLIAGGVAIAVMGHFTRARLTTARTQALSLRQAAESWRLSHVPEDCPTADALVASGVVDEASKMTDPWDVPYEIACEGEQTRVRSFGPDKRKGTDDDIVVPAPHPDAPRAALRPGDTLLREWNRSTIRPARWASASSRSAGATPRGSTRPSPR